MHLRAKCEHLVPIALQIVQLCCLIVWFKPHKIHLTSLRQNSSEWPKPAHLKHWAVLGVGMYLATLAEIPAIKSLL